MSLSSVFTDRVDLSHSLAAGLREAVLTLQASAPEGKRGSFSVDNTRWLEADLELAVPLTNRIIFEYLRRPENPEGKSVAIDFVPNQGHINWFAIAASKQELLPQIITDTESCKDYSARAPRFDVGTTADLEEVSLSLSFSTTQAEIRREFVRSLVSINHDPRQEPLPQAQSAHDRLEQFATSFEQDMLNSLLLDSDVDPKTVIKAFIPDRFHTLLEVLRHCLYSIRDHQGFSIPLDSPSPTNNATIYVKLAAVIRHNLQSLHQLP